MTNDIGYAVTCDACHGQMFINGILCEKCHGDGRIMVTDADHRKSRMWNWLKRRLGIAGWQERRQRERRDDARSNMGK